MKIVDPKGTWLINSGVYPLVDAESGTVFEPGVPTRALHTVWVKSQPTILQFADPLAPAKADPPKSKSSPIPEKAQAASA